MGQGGSKTPSSSLSFFKKEGSSTATKLLQSQENVDYQQEAQQIIEKFFWPQKVVFCIKKIISEMKNKVPLNELVFNNSNSSFSTIFLMNCKLRIEGNQTVTIQNSVIYGQLALSPGNANAPSLNFIDCLFIDAKTDKISKAVFTNSYFIRSEITDGDNFTITRSFARASALRSKKITMNSSEFLEGSQINCQQGIHCQGNNVFLQLEEGNTFSLIESATSLSTPSFTIIQTRKKGKDDSFINEQDLRIFFIKLAAQQRMNREEEQYHFTLFLSAIKEIWRQAGLENIHNKINRLEELLNPKEKDIQDYKKLVNLKMTGPTDANQQIITNYQEYLKAVKEKIASINHPQNAILS